MRIAIVLTSLLLLAACGKSQPDEPESKRDRHTKKLAWSYPSGISLQAPRKTPDKPDGRAGDWEITSDTMDIGAAETDAIAQVAAGNCRLIGDYGYSMQISHAHKKEGDVFDDIEPIYGYIHVADTGCVVTPETRNARPIARAYGQVYNTVVVTRCDYSTATIKAWKAKFYAKQKSDKTVN